MYINNKVSQIQSKEVGDFCKRGHMKRKFLIIILFLLLILTGCSPNNSKEELHLSISEVVSEPYQNDTGTKTFTVSYLPLGNLYYTAIVKNNLIYGSCIIDGKSVIIVQDKETGSIKQQIELPLISDEEINVKHITCDDNGNLYVFAENETGEEDFFWRINSNGEILEQGYLSLRGTEKAINRTLNSVQIDETGKLYFWYTMGLPLSEVKDDATEEEADVYTMVSRLYVKDTQMNELFYIQAAHRGQEILGLTVGKNEKVYFVRVNGEGGMLQGIDLNKQDFSDELLLLTDDYYSMSHFSGIVSAISDGILYCNAGILYQYNYSSEINKELLSLSSYGLIESDILYLGNEGTGIEMINNFGTSSELVSITEGVSSKKKLTFGILQEAGSLDTLIAAFNRYSRDAMIEAVYYYDDKIGFDEGVERLKLDIVQGKAPDIIDVSSIDYLPFVEKGVLLDLNEFMQSEQEYGPEKLCESVRKAYQIGDKLYSIAPGFQLHTMWGKTSVIGAGTGLSLNSLREVLKRNGKDLNAIFGFSADESVLTTLCTFGMDELIDWENKTCDFGGQYFQELLSFAKEYNGGYSAGSVSRGIGQGEILISAGIIFNVADYQVQKELYGDDITFIGYPVLSGSGTAVCYSGTEIAINADSEQREQAWDFVKFYIENGYNGLGFPVAVEQLKAFMENAMKQDIVDDQEGGQYELPKGTYSDEDTYVEVFAASQEEVDKVWALIETVNGTFDYNIDILNIINEEAEAYFSGMKTVSETAETIQNRVQLYLQE